MTISYIPKIYFSKLDEPVVVYELDKERKPKRFVYINARAREVLQFTKDEFYDIEIDSVISLEQLDQLVGQEEQLHNTEFELSFKTAHDSSMKFMVVPNLVRFDNQEYLEIICLTRTIVDDYNSDLQIAHNRFYTMASYLHEGLTILENRRVVYTNKAMELITGYSAKEIHTLTESVEFLAAPDEKKRVRDFLMQMQQYPERRHVMDFWIVTKHGERKNIHNSYSQHSTKNGVIQYILTQDVTQRKRTEMAIVQKENEFNTLADNLQGVITMFNRELECLYINIAGAAIFGKEEIEIVGSKLSDMGLSTDNYQLIRHNLIQVFSSQENAEIEIFINSAKGQQVMHTLFVPANFVEGNIDTAFVLMSEITELVSLRKKIKDIEDRNKLILNDLIDMIWVLDREYKVTYVSPSVEKLTGYTVEEYPQVPFDKVFDADGTEAVNQLFQNISQGVKTGHVSQLKHAHSITAQQTRRDGSMVWVELVARPLFDGQDNFIGISGVTRDISKRKAAESALVMAKEKAIEADRLKSAFLANMSHEIRTPMNAIIGFADLLNEVDIDAESKMEYVELINSNSVRLLSLIDDIIDISKIEAGELTVKQVDVPVLPVFKQLWAVNHETIESMGKADIQLKYSAVSSNLSVIADPVRLKQVFNNLISNSIKFTNTGKIEYGIVVHDKNFARFYVTDTGIGLSEEKLAFIFDRFRQVDEHTNRKYQGSGLGLAISKQLVELMGGALWVESELNVGTTFYFTLPHQWADDDIINQVVEQKEEEIRNVMVVEDEDTNFQLLKEMLKKKNFRIFRAHDGLEALEIAKEEQLDLILMDIQLPKMDGYEATRRIRIDFPYLPIIAQTAYANYSDVVKSLDAGCNDFIAKPIKMKKLLTMVDKYLLGE